LSVGIEVAFTDGIMKFNKYVGFVAFSAIFCASAFSQSAGDAGSIIQQPLQSSFTDKFGRLTVTPLGDGQFLVEHDKSVCAGEAPFAMCNYGYLPPCLTQLNSLTAPQHGPSTFKIDNDITLYAGIDVNTGHLAYMIKGSDVALRMSPLPASSDQSDPTFHKDLAYWKAHASSCGASPTAALASTASSLNDLINQGPVEKISQAAAQLADQAGVNRVASAAYVSPVSADSIGSGSAR
jgi:hypothetical protein